MSNRAVDINGYVTIERNPISRSGVFPYSGRNLPGADPDKIYNVLRPAEELSNPETLKSFAMIPLIDEHVMLGDGYSTAPEEKGVHGATGAEVIFDEGVMYAPLRIFSKTLKSIIDSGKRGLSLGYRCEFLKSSGIFDGTSYDYVQRNLRGNHLALVAEGRMGKDIVVLDGAAYDHFDLETKGMDIMAEEEKKKDAMDAIAALAEQVGALAKRMDARDEKEEEDKKKAEDEAEEEKKKKEAEDEDEKKKEGMDAIDARLKAIEAKPAVAMDTKALLADITRRDQIVRDVTPLIGTFDHADKTADEVVAYACDHLKLNAPKGQEMAVLGGYLAGRKSAADTRVFALDKAPKAGGKFAEFMKG